MKIETFLGASPGYPLADLQILTLEFLSRKMVFWSLSKISKIEETPGHGVGVYSWTTFTLLSPIFVVN